MSVSWESAFVAVAAVAGEPLDVIARALGVADVTDDARTPELLRTLRSAPREARARALARTLAEVALTVPGPV